MKKITGARLTTLPAIAMTGLLFSFAAPAGAAIPWNIETGIGYDSNPYRTPSSTYIDYAQAGNPTINPNIQSGFFIPIKGAALLTDENNPGGHFNTEYKLNADKYLDSALTNADEYSHRLSIGKTLNRTSPASGDKLYTEFEFGINRKTYFDHDDGLPKTTALGTNISNRYNYLSYGINIDYDSKASTLPYTLTASIERLDYDDPVATTQLDHNRLELGIDSETIFSASNKFKYGYHYKSRSYSNRHARDTTGTISTQLLDYDYHTLGLSLRSRFTDHLAVYFDYQLERRNDGYLGYNDSTKHKFKIRNIYKTDNTRTRLALSYYSIDYANAFNYENTARGSKRSDALKADLKTEFSYGDYQLWVALELTDKNSTDLRYQYDRYQASVGISLAL